MVISGQHVQTLRDTPVCLCDQVPQPFEQIGTQSAEPSYQPVPIAMAMAAL